MKFVKCNRDKIISITLVLSVLMVTSISSASLFGNKELNHTYNSNNVFVQKIDDNHAKLSCDSLKTTENDLMFSKSEVPGGYQYDISNFNNDKRFYSFKSKDDIVINECLTKDSNLCSAIASAVMAPTVASVAGAVGSAGTAAIAAAPVVGTVVGAGATSAAGIGWTAGASVAAAACVAVAPVAIIGGAVFGALTVG